MKRLEYQSSDSGKTDYGDDNKIVNIICEAYPKNLNEDLNNTTSMINFDIL